MAGDRDRLRGDHPAPPVEWSALPFVLDIQQLAAVLGKGWSVTSIRRALREDRFPILPRPRYGRTSPYTWSRASVQRHVEGPAIGAPRNYFSKAKARLRAAS